jgi:hypothetical protein
MRLMMVSNDINMTHRLQEILKLNISIGSKDFDEGTRQYLMRLACAQAFEALSILPELTQSKSISIVLNKDTKAKEALERLLEYKSGGRFSKSWDTLRLIRNVGMFHYKSIGKWSVECLEKRVRDGLTTSTLVWTDDENIPPRFVLADEIQQMVFTYKLLGHHDGKDFNLAFQESTKIFNDVQQDIAYVVVPIVLNGIQHRYR